MITLNRFLVQYMWPLALVTLACIPIMGFATNVRMKQMLGEEDQKKEDSPDELNSPAGEYSDVFPWHYGIHANRSTC